MESPFKRARLAPLSLGFRLELCRQHKSARAFTCNRLLPSATSCKHNDSLVFGLASGLLIINNRQPNRRTPSGLETGRQASIETQNQLATNNTEDGEEPCAKRSGRSVMSHVATEQRRRDKINEGYVAIPRSVC